VQSRTSRSMTMCAVTGRVEALMDTDTVKVHSRLLLHGFKTSKVKVLSTIYFRMELQHIRAGLHVIT
jgi:hypothetical protein